MKIAYSNAMVLVSSLSCLASVQNDQTPLKLQLEEQQIARNMIQLQNTETFWNNIYFFIWWNVNKLVTR